MTTPVLHILSLIQSFVGLFIFLIRVIRFLNAVFDFGAYSEKCLVNVFAHFSWSFYKFYAQRVSKLFTLFICDLDKILNLSLVLQVAFVTHENFTDLFTGIFLNLDKPIFDVLETLFISYIIDQNDAMSSLVIRTGDYL